MNICRYVEPYDWATNVTIAVWSIFAITALVIAYFEWRAYRESK